MEGKKNLVILGALFFWTAWMVMAPGADAAPGDTSVLVAYTTALPDEGKTPLILVHGIHGNRRKAMDVDDVDAPNWGCWQTFLTYFYHWDNTGLRDRYKLYGFFYESDTIPVEKIGKQFRDKVQAQTGPVSGAPHSLEDVPMVILAHSMGGLVARSFMNEELTYAGKWSGKKAGDRVLGLITLATPHHGTPAASECAKLRLATEPWPLWQVLLEAGDLVYWWPHGVISPVMPNRSDLRWDNYDGSMTPVGYHLDCAYMDKNQWLIDLNRETQFHHKIISYAGYIDPQDPLRVDLVNAGPAVIGDYLLKHADTDREKLIGSGIVIKEGLRCIYGENDGMVPLSSAQFDGHTVKYIRTLFDFDHSEMKGNGLNPSNEKYQSFFNLLGRDLDALAITVQTLPEAIHALDPVVFSPKGDINDTADFEWTFHDGTVSHEKTPEFIFRQEGTFEVSLRVNDPVLGDITRTRKVIVHKPDFSVSSPQGEGSLLRRFSAPDSHLIRSIEWRFGGTGTLVEGDAHSGTAAYQYQETGSYTVSLTLVLDDASRLVMSKSIQAGGGPFYICGAHITGDEKWAGNSQYFVTGDIHIGSGGSLTIAPGARVEMGDNRRFIIYGRLAADRVTFTTAGPSVHWNGILISGTEAGQSRLENSVFQYARGTLGNTGQGVIYIKNGSPSVSGCTFSETSPSADTHGIIIDSGSPMITHNTLDKTIYITGPGAPIVTGNTLDRIFIQGNAGGIYQGNTLNGINVKYNTNAPEFRANTFLNNGLIRAQGVISTQVAWAEDTGDLFLIGPDALSIAPGGSLTIAPGKTLQISGDQITVYGTLKASDVRFTSYEDSGFWEKIKFSGPGASASLLENCRFDFPEGADRPWDAPVIEIVQGAAPALSGCTITDNIRIQFSNASGRFSGNTLTGIIDGTVPEDTGVSLTEAFPRITGNTIKGFETAVSAVYSGDDPDLFPIISGNTLTHNTYGIGISGSGILGDNLLKDNDYGISLAFVSEDLKIFNNTYVDNRKADLVLGGTINTQVAEQAILYQIPYSMDISETGRLFFPPGSTVKLGKNVKINVSGALHAHGVRFTRSGPYAWDGIVFNGVDPGPSALSACTLEEGAQVKLIHTHLPVTGSSFSDMALLLESSSSYIMNNQIHCTGRTLPCGIISDHASSPVMTDNQIQGSGSGEGTGIGINGSAVMIGNTITQTGTGIYIHLYWPPSEGADILITGNTLGNNRYGMYIPEFHKHSRIHMNGNTISNNSDYGVYWDGDGTNRMLNAVNNFWGDRSGPLDRDDDRSEGGLYNPGGLGDRVSNHLAYSPWLPDAIELKTIGDTDQDRDVDGTDMAEFATQFATGSQGADINKDQGVNTLDIKTFAVQMGEH